MNLIDPTTPELVSRALDAGALRHSAIAQNIANANVTGARALKVAFEELLGTVREDVAMGRPVSAQDLPEPQVRYSEAPQAIALDDEVGALSSNAVHYQALIRAIDKQLALVGLAIHEGKR